jgi:hypothetical protein
MRRPTVVEWVLVAAVAFCALHGTRDETAHLPKVRCAILLHGLGPRASKASCTSSAYRAQRYALPLLDGRAGQECEIPNFKASYLGRFPLVSADFWTSDHLSERPRRVDAFFGTRARGTLTLKRR